MRKRVMRMLLAVVLLTELLLGGGTFYFVSTFLLERSTERMQDMASLWMSQAAFTDVQQQAEEWATALNAQHDVYRLTVVDAAGSVLADTDARPESMENHLNREEIRMALETGYGKARRYSPTMKTDYLYVAVSDGTRVFRIAQNVAQIRHLQNTILLILLGTGLASLLCAYLSSFLTSRFLLKPIDALRLGAGRIADGDLQHRIAPQPDELGALAEDFNRMAEALAEALHMERAQSAQMQAVLTGIPVGVLAVDRAEKVTQCNPEAQKLLRLEEPVLGEALRQVTREGNILELLHSTMETAARKSAEWTTDKVLRASAAPVLDEQGGVSGAVLVLSDMTQIRYLEQLRSEFVANATHELKTPLTAIRGCIETLRDPQVDTSDPALMGEMLEIMDVQGERLQTLIGDMLTLSEIESVSNLSGVGDLAEAVRQAVRAVGVQAEQCEVSLQLHAPDALPCSAQNDRMRRIAQNLIENAVRYNHAGGHVWIDVRREGAKAVLTVRDDGVGIPEKDIPRICERFYRVDKDRSRNSGGTGLGLAIVKHMVRRYEGDMEIQSEVGKGSCFTVRLPMPVR